MAQIILFSRTSTTVQDVEQQTKDLIKQAEMLGYSRQNQIIVEYQESGIKLDINTRQGIKKLKETIISNTDIDCVICWELTRIARRADVIYNIRDFLLEHRIRWIVCKPYMEIIDSTGKVTQVSSLMLGIFSSFAESEMMIKSERFARARAEMKAQGKKSTGATIFGYVKNQEKRMVPHPVNAQIIIDAFSYYTENSDASYYSTYEYLMGKYPTEFPSLPYKKAQHKIRHFFENSIYWEGNWCYPKLVNEDLYKKVKEKAEKARCVPKYERKGNWLGRGKLYCRHCGNVIIPVGGKTNAYYCTTDKEHNVTININAVEWLLWEEARVIMNIKSSIDNKQLIIKTNDKIAELNNIIDEHKKQYNTIETKQSKLVEIYIDGKITKDIFEDKNTELEEERNKLNDKINNANAQILELQNILKNTQNDIHVKPVNYDEVDNFDTKLEIVRQVIDKVWVDKIEPKTYSLDFEYRGVIVPQVGHYIYVARNQYKRIYRLNDDGTKDFIYEDAKTYKNPVTGRYAKIELQK